MNPIYNHSKKVRHQHCLWGWGADSYKCDLWRCLALFRSVQYVFFLTFSVFLCSSLYFDPSGQSNMGFTMNQIFNSTEEMEASVGYTDIRFTVLKRVTSDVEMDDIEPQVFTFLHLNTIFTILLRLLGLIPLNLNISNICQLCASFLQGVLTTRNLKGGLSSITLKAKELYSTKKLFCQRGTPSSGFDRLGMGWNQVL